MHETALTVRLELHQPTLLLRSLDRIEREENVEIPPEVEDNAARDQDGDSVFQVIPLGHGVRTLIGNVEHENGQ